MYNSNSFISIKYEVERSNTNMKICLVMIIFEIGRFLGHLIFIRIDHLLCLFIATSYTGSQQVD